MSGYYTVSDNALSEARNLLSQKGSDELQKLMNNDEELTRFVNNLTEVIISKFEKEKSNLFFFFRFNNSKRPRKV